ncbi:MAG TPA: hypothetical protein VGM93_15930 [Acidimicrobiales bacterium]
MTEPAVAEPAVLAPLPTRPIPGWALLLLVVLNTVTTVGLVGDIQRHVQNQSLTGKDFLSSWHLVLYGGVLGVGIWLGLVAYWLGPPVLRGEARFAMIGFLGLSVGGACDAAWHSAFGAERAVEALVSPPHLLVFAALSMLLVSPLAALWRRPGSRLGVVDSACAAISVVSALLVASLFTGYLSPLTGGMDLGNGYVDAPIGTSISDFDVVRGLGVVLWTTVLVIVPWSLVLQRFRLRPGFALAGGAILGLPPVIVINWYAGEPVFFGFVALGFVIEVAGLVGGKTAPGPWARGAIGVVAPAALWGTLLLVQKLHHLLVWSPALWGGAIMLSAVWGGAAATVATRSRAHEPPAT